jgi:multidrug efflux pump subunit AcrA (membrane-fusion protein)
MRTAGLWGSVLLAGALSACGGDASKDATPAEPHTVSVAKAVLVRESATEEFMGTVAAKSNQHQVNSSARGAWR